MGKIIQFRRKPEPGCTMDWWTYKARYEYKIDEKTIAECKTVTDLIGLCTDIELHRIAKILGVE